MSLSKPKAKAFYAARIKMTSRSCGGRNVRILAATSRLPFKQWTSGAKWIKGFDPSSS
jgi:hypothetical protein